MKNPQSYDCVIWGNSRVTLLNPRKIKHHHCYNFAFSSGTPSEFMSFAKYLKYKGGPIHTMIIGLDGRNFWRKSLSYKVPEFVEKTQKPPSIFKSYLSLNVLGFSLRSIIGNNPLGRYYKRDFIGSLNSNSPRLNPSVCMPTEKNSRHYSLDNKHFYDELIGLYSNTYIIGYVPPVTAWDITVLYFDKTLDSYLWSIYEAAKDYNLFYDFSIPSSITTRLDNSDNESHYTDNTSDRVAKRLNGEDDDFGIALHKTSWPEYRKAYVEAVEKFIQKEKKNLKFDLDCKIKSEVR